MDVKTGSFNAEYGRSTGGIINVLTKGGSNEYHGEVFVNLRPDSLLTPNGKVVGNDGEAIGYYAKPGEGTFNLDYGFQLGGPIMKDKLWFFVGFAPITTKTYYNRFQRLNITTADQPGCSTRGGDFDALGNADPRCRDANGFALYNAIPGSDYVYNTAQTSYQWTGKLSFLIDQNNTVSLSTYGQPSTLTTHRTFGVQNDNADFDQAIDSYDVIGKYAGKFHVGKDDQAITGRVQGGLCDQGTHGQNQRKGNQEGRRCTLYS